MSVLLRNEYRETSDKTVIIWETKVRLTRDFCLMNDKGSMMNLESPLNQQTGTGTIQ